jgi:hypothetical protein
VHCLVSLRRAHAAAHDPRWRRRRLQLSRWRQQASAQPSTSTSTVPSTKCFIYHTLGPGGSGGDRTRLKNILVRTSSTAAQPAAESSSHRRQLGAAHCDHKAQHTLSHGLAGSHDRAHSSLQLHPHRHRRLTHPRSRASLPAPPLRRACCCPRSHCPAPNQRPVAGFRFSSAHTPTPACTRLATLVPLTLIRPPSCCTTRCDAWLTRVADSSTLPTDSLACLLASIAKHCPHHSFGFELCEFPRHHHPIPVSRDFTFTSGYLCLTLRRFASQHSHLHARH